MKTKAVSLVYTVTQKDVFPPPKRELERKDKFIETVQHSVEADYKPKQIKVTYEVFNPEIVNLRAFFHTCIKYYGMQNSDLTDRELTTKEFKQYREEILDELLGYDFQTVTKLVRKRPSTADYKDTQPWLTLLQNLEETLFDTAGYQFPDTKQFWAWVEQWGYIKANDMALKQLQERLRKKV